MSENRIQNHPFIRSIDNRFYHGRNQVDPYANISGGYQFGLPSSNIGQNNLFNAFGLTPGQFSNNFGFGPGSNVSFDQINTFYRNGLAEYLSGSPQYSVSGNPGPNEVSIIPQGMNPNSPIPPEYFSNYPNPLNARTFREMTPLNLASLYNQHPSAALDIASSVLGNIQGTEVPINPNSQMAYPVNIPPGMQAPTIVGGMYGMQDMQNGITPISAANFGGIPMQTGNFYSNTPGQQRLEGVDQLFQTFLMSMLMAPPMLQSPSGGMNPVILGPGQNMATVGSGYGYDPNYGWPAVYGYNSQNVNDPFSTTPGTTLMMPGEPTTQQSTPAASTASNTSYSVQTPVDLNAQFTTSSSSGSSTSSTSSSTGSTTSTSSSSALAGDARLDFILQVTSSHEGSYTTVSKDSNDVISFGFIQFNQNGGLPALLRRMEEKDPAAFQRIFQGKNTDQLLAIPNLYDEPYKSMFQEAGAYPPFQEAQREQAIAGYMNPAINTLKEWGIADPVNDVSPVLLAHMFDTNVNFGVGGGSGIFDEAVRRTGLHPPLSEAQAQDLSNMIGEIRRERSEGKSYYNAMVNRTSTYMSENGQPSEFMQEFNEQTSSLA